MAYNWALFLNDEFHSSFQKELSKQLFEKGKNATGIENFEKIDFQIIIGLHDLEINQVKNKVFAKIDFVTPASFSIPVCVFWTVENETNIIEIHKNDISSLKVDINWCDGFPLQEILPHMIDYD